MSPDRAMQSRMRCARCLRFARIVAGDEMAPDETFLTLKRGAMVATVHARCHVDS